MEISEARRQLLDAFTREFGSNMDDLDRCAAKCKKPRAEIIAEMLEDEIDYLFPIFESFRAETGASC